MKKYYEVIQEECSDCGICCLASIIKYYGGNVSLESLRFYTETSNKGTNAYELINCARKFGLDSFGERIEILENIKLPVIAHLKLENEFFHFVVIYEIKNNFIYLMDPSIGLKKIKLEEFYKIYTGNILHFRQVGEIPKYKKSEFMKNKLFTEIKNNKKSFFILLFMSFIILGLTMINNLGIELLNKNYNYCFVLFFIIFLNEFLNLIKNNIMLKNNINFNNKIIKEFVIHIFKLPLNYLKLKQKGEISTRFNELNDVSNNIINFCFDVILSFMLCFISILFISKFSSKLFFTIFILTILYITFNLKVYKKLVNEIRYSVNLEESYNSNILDYISNFDTIKHLNIYNYFINNINSNLNKKNNVTKTLNKKIYLFSMINNMLFNIFLILIYIFLLKSNFAMSKCLVIITLINLYISNMKNIVDLYPTFILFKTYVNKNSEFLSFEIKENNKFVNTFSKIIIKNLSYKINNFYILENINYKINREDKIFIKGPSGSGKSTLMKILNNEIKKYIGNVYLDNFDIRKYDLSTLVTYISQNETLFDDTLYNNLCLGKDVQDKDIDLVIKVCRLDNINIDLNSNFINNNILSGGEKNRVILARSLIHSNNILILDEVLKEVDYELEVNIIKDILKYYSDKTIIYISHKDVGYLFDRVLTFRKEKGK